MDLEYWLPITSRDTVLGLAYQRSNSEIVENPFDVLDIESESQIFGITLAHPVYRSPSWGLEVGITGEHRRSETSVLGEPFSFGLGADDGESVVSVLRVFQELTWRTRTDVISGRFTTNFGIDARMVSATKSGCKCA